MIKAINFTAKDKVNALAGASSLKDFAGNTMRVIGAALDEVTDIETGAIKAVGYLVVEDNGTRRVVSTISATAIDSIGCIIDYMEEEKAAVVDIAVNSRKSNGGREFLTISVV